MDMDRESALDETQHILVELKAKVGMMTSLHENLGPSKAQRFLDLPGQLFSCQDVSLGMAGGPIKGTKAATADAQIRIIDVPVDYIADDSFRMFPETDLLSQPRKLIEISLPVELQCLIDVEALPQMNIVDRGF